MDDITLIDLHRNIFKGVGGPQTPSDTLRTVADWIGTWDSELSDIEKFLGLERTSRLILEVPINGDVHLNINLSRGLLENLVNLCVPVRHMRPN